MCSAKASRVTVILNLLIFLYFELLNQNLTLYEDKYQLFLRNGGQREKSEGHIRIQHPEILKKVSITDQGKFIK